ncbi:MAG: TraB/GumN family protein [Wenzhouxiangellaceae bacterium]
MAEPPRWVVRDADSEMVLFPTIHVLPDDLNWTSDAMLERLAQAEEVWFEIDLAEAQSPELQQIVMQRGLDASRPLTETLGEDLYQRFLRLAESLGIPAAQLEPMRPWLASLTLSSVALANAGFSADAGVEAKLRQHLDAQRLRALETPAEQIAALADLPEQVQVAMLESALGEIEAFAKEMRTLAQDWSRGNIDGMETLLVEEMATEYPELYDAVFRQRNLRWVEIIEAELNGAGTDFIAVGAGHLVGDDSVIQLLRARGWTVERVTGDDS